ncbi:hypothetical protein [Cellulomonas iranensis]|uniref:hypothetical protein n=1 Tax=Cellulomonas iranensis TaxID=76862 RepID=UPI000B3C45AC|nr:hypothetical protein [Cellulomonas iranensis]
MPDDDYDEVEAVVRIPKDGRLADSRKTEGWSRGYTAKSSEKGPEHVEIRLTGDRKAARSHPDREPEMAHEGEYEFSPLEHDEDEGETTVEHLVRALVFLGLLAAAAWAEPQVRRFLADQVLPFLTARRERIRAWFARRKAGGAGANPTEPAQLGAGPEAREVGDALLAYEAEMTSEEARQHLVELLVARHFVDEKLRLLASSRVGGASVPPDVAAALQALTPAQVSRALESLLQANPSLPQQLRPHLDVRRDGLPLHLVPAGVEELMGLVDRD